MVHYSRISLVYSGLVTAKTIKPEQMSPYVIANYVINPDLCKFFLIKLRGRAGNLAHPLVSMIKAKA